MFVPRANYAYLSASTCLFHYSLPSQPWPPARRRASVFGGDFPGRQPFRAGDEQHVIVSQFGHSQAGNERAVVELVEQVSLGVEDMDRAVGAREEPVDRIAARQVTECDRLDGFVLQAVGQVVGPASSRSAPLSRRPSATVLPIPGMLSPQSCRPGFSGVAVGSGLAASSDPGHRPRRRPGRRGWPEVWRRFCRRQVFRGVGLHQVLGRFNGHDRTEPSRALSSRCFLPSWSSSTSVPAPFAQSRLRLPSASGAVAAR